MDGMICGGSRSQDGGRRIRHYKGRQGRTDVHRLVAATVIILDHMGLLQMFSAHTAVKLYGYIRLPAR